MLTPVFAFILLILATLTLTRYINSIVTKRLKTRLGSSAPKSNEMISILTVIEKDEEQDSQNAAERKPNNYDEIRKTKPHIWLD